MFSLIKFLKEDSIEVVPSCWLSEDLTETSWPAFVSTLKISRAIKEQQRPLNSWKKVPCRVLYKADTYTDVAEKISFAERCLDIDSKTDAQKTIKKKRKRRVPEQYINASSDEDEAATTKGVSPPFVDAIVETSSDTEHEIGTQTGKEMRTQFFPEPSHVASRHGNISVQGCVVRLHDILNPGLSRSPASVSRSQGGFVDLKNKRNFGQSFPQVSSNVSDTYADVAEKFLFAERSLDIESKIDAQTLKKKKKQHSPERFLNAVSDGTTKPVLSTPKTPRRPLIISVCKDNAYSVKKKILSTLQTIRGSLQLHGCLLTQVLQRLEPDPVIAEVEGLPDLPLLNMEEFFFLEALLATNVEVKQCMVAKLGRIGGNTISEVTRNIMKCLMDPYLTLHFNWCGRKGKTSFRNFKMRQLVYDAVRENKKMRAAKDKEIEHVVKLFLKHIGDRISTQTALTIE